MGVRALGWEDPLEEGLATHFSILAWRIPWTEEPDRLLSVMSDSPARVLCPWDSPGKNTGVDCQALLQGIFPTQGLNPRLL